MTLPIPLMTVSLSLLVGTALMLLHVLAHIFTQFAIWFGLTSAPAEPGKR